MDNSRCVILVPAGRYIEPHCEFSLRQLEAQGHAVRRLYGFAQIDVARNRLASEAIADGFEELMWIDSDIAFEPQSVQRLRSHGLPIVCGLYPKKLERVVLPVPARSEIGHPGGGTVKIVGFRGKLGLSKRRNLLRYSPTWKDPYFTDGAAHGRSLGGKAERNHLVSQPLAGTRAGVREEPRSLEGEVQDVAGAAQGFPHRSAGSGSFARSVASQGGGPGTGNQPTACPVAAAS